MATDAWDPTWFLAFVPIDCYCSQKHVAVFQTRFDTDIDAPPLRSTDFKLVHVDDSTSMPLDGVYHGRRVKGILASLFRRWNTVADLTVICTPFISSRFTKGEWEWLLKHSSGYSTRVITRSVSAGLMKRLPVFQKKLDPNVALSVAFGEGVKGFEERVMVPIFVESSLTRYQKFHAKFFAGIFSNHVEALLSSYNLFEKEDTQLEQVSFRYYSREFFARRFLSPFGIRKLSAPPDSFLEMTSDVEVVSFFGNSGECVHYKYRNRIWKVIRECLTTIEAKR